MKYIKDFEQFVPVGCDQNIVFSTEPRKNYYIIDENGKKYSITKNEFIHDPVENLVEKYVIK